MIRRVVRVAKRFAEAQALDREDVAGLSMEERISAVEELRRQHFGTGFVEKVLVCADRPSRAARARRRPHRRGPA